MKNYTKLEYLNGKYQLTFATEDKELAQTAFNLVAGAQLNSGEEDKKEENKKEESAKERRMVLEFNSAGKIWQSVYPLPISLSRIAMEVANRHPEAGLLWAMEVESEVWKVFTNTGYVVVAIVYNEPQQD